MNETTNQQAVPVNMITSENDDMIIIVRFKNPEIAQALGEEIAKRGIQPVEGMNEPLYQIATDELFGLFKK